MTVTLRLLWRADEGAGRGERGQERKAEKLFFSEKTSTNIAVQSDYIL